MNEPQRPVLATPDNVGCVCEREGKDGRFCNWRSACDRRPTQPDAQTYPEPPEWIQPSAETKCPNCDVAWYKDSVHCTNHVQPGRAQPCDCQHHQFATTVADELGPCDCPHCASHRTQPDAQPEPVDHTSDPRHADYDVDHKREGWFWRCRFCGWLGVGLATEDAAHREACRHLERERAQPDVLVCDRCGETVRAFLPKNMPDADSWHCFNAEEGSGYLRKPAQPDAQPEPTCTCETTGAFYCPEHGPEDAQPEPKTCGNYANAACGFHQHVECDVHGGGPVDAQPEPYPPASPEDNAKARAEGQTYALPDAQPEPTDDPQCSCFEGSAPCSECGRFVFRIDCDEWHALRAELADAIKQLVSAEADVDRLAENWRVSQVRAERAEAERDELATKLARMTPVVEAFFMATLDHSCNLEGFDGGCYECQAVKAMRAYREASDD